MTTHHYQLELWDITKQYPGCLANNKINLKLERGEIHALLGENGAGKSTLVKIIYGLVTPDSGSIVWDGQELQIRSPSHARELGIGMVFQHFSLFETLTVTENIDLCLTPSMREQIGDLAGRIRELSGNYGLNIDPDRYVFSLSMGERQRVEILRCLIQQVKLLILDEPTSVLTPQEVDSLFVVLRQLASDGCTILFISHKLKEVTALCHNATILRGGRVTGACVPANETPESIARMMVGDSAIAETYERRSSKKINLAVKDLSLPAPNPFACALKQLNFSLRGGEILGIAGVAGNGQEELLSVLSGEWLSPHSDQIIMNGKPVGRLKVGNRRQLGMAYVPAERLGHGAAPKMSLRENLLLTNATLGLKRWGWVKWNKVSARTRDVIEQHQVKCHNEHAPAHSLSGGNLQKFIIGRELALEPNVFVCAHPTWGVDIGAANAIYRELMELRDRGAAIVVISEDLDELFLISDRIAALFDGHLSPLVKTQETSTNQIGQWMAGQFLEQE
ncbi:MAG: ABC transporter ATP-binding protein [Gammaproteobacteria bacterium]|nr:ABC transporter ATP-binding protein [Gammaproteobacteria bacterium]